MNYDADGNRVRETRGGRVETYVYDGMGNLSPEQDTQSNETPGLRYLSSDYLGSTRLITSATGTVLHRRDYLPFGEEISASATTYGGRGTAAVGGYNANQSITQQFTGKERDTETGLDYFQARYLSSAQGRFASPDPTFLNILRVVNPQRWNQYTYAVNNPLKYVDPDGQEPIAIRYPGYHVGLPKGMTAPLGHAGVVMVAKDGSTHYFEYGRYSHADSVPGVVRNAGPNNTPTPPLERDALGKFTAQSMERLLAVLSQTSGKGGPVDALVFDTTYLEDAVMEAYLKERQRQNTDAKRKPYSIFNHNCGTLICDAFDRVGHPTPNRFVLWGATPGGIFDLLRAKSGQARNSRISQKKKRSRPKSATKMVPVISLLNCKSI